MYIDGFNLYYGCLKGTPYRWLDLDALCRRLLPNDHIHRIRYFTAMVTPRQGDPQQAQRQQTYLRALATIPHLTIHLGHYLSHPTKMPLAHPPARGSRTVEVIKTEEKGSDVNLATMLLLDAFMKDSEASVVISNDSDLKLPVELAQSELTRVVGVINPHPASHRSRALRPSFFKQIRKSALKTSQFPPNMKDSVGNIRRPAYW